MYITLALHMFKVKVYHCLKVHVLLAFINKHGQDYRKQFSYSHTDVCIAGIHNKMIQIFSQIL